MKLTKFLFAALAIVFLAACFGCSTAGYARKSTADLATDEAGNPAYETTKRTVSKPVLVADQLAYETETVETSKPVLAEAEKVRGGTKRLLASGELVNLEASGNATNRVVKIGTLKDKPEPEAIAAAGTAGGNIIGSAVSAATGSGSAVKAAADVVSGATEKKPDAIEKIKEVLEGDK
jgi:hypothetical protein